MMWWNRLRSTKCIDRLTITYHSEQTADYRHAVDVLNLFHNEPVSTICQVTHVEDTLDLALEGYQFIRENTGATVVLKAMMTAYDIYGRYTPDQLEIVRSLNGKPGELFGTKVLPNVPRSHQINHMLKITYDAGFSKAVDPQVLMKTKENVFIGWKCDTGKDFMRIEGNKAYRGVCREAGIKPDYSFTNDFISCTKERCFCSSDLVSTKILDK